MQDSGIYLPSTSGFQLICARKIQEFIVAFVPAFQATADVIFRRTRVEAHERVREVVWFEVILRREVVSLGFAFLIHPCGELIILVQVMWDRAKIIEELAQEIEATVLGHDIRAK